MQLNYSQIKILAIFAMTIDHIAWLWIDTSSFLGQFMHFLGRLTAPLMCFLLVEGFFKTRNFYSYFLRLFLFACLAQFPFVVMLKGLDFFVESPTLLFFKGNVLFNLGLALLALGIFYKSQFHVLVKSMMLCALLFFASFMDWGVFIILFTLVFARYRANRQQQLIAYTITAMGLLLLVDLGIVHGLPTLVLQWMPIGILLVPLILMYCNYESGSRWGGRYFFYIYYPLHMFILATLAYLI